MNICVFTRSLNLGGAEKQSIILSHYLQKFYNVYLVILYPRGLYYEQAQKLGIKIIPIEGIFIVKLFKFYLFLKKNRIQVIFNYQPVTNIIGITVAKIAKVKLIYGGIRSSKYKGLVRMFAQRFLCNHFSNAFISNSYFAREIFTKKYGFKNKKIAVIQNGIILSNGNTIDKFSNDKVIILSIGRFIKEKDFFTAINSIEFLIKHHPHIKYKIEYLIFGYGTLRNKLIDYVKAKELDSIIRIMDYVVTKETYSNADIFLNTSLIEGMPNTVMEAMSFQLPLIATDVGDTKYLVNDGVNGYLVRTKDYKEISKKLLILINDPQQRDKFGRNGYEILSKEFKIETIFQQYRSLINNSLKND